MYNTAFNLEVELFALLLGCLRDQARSAGGGTLHGLAGSMPPRSSSLGQPFSHGHGKRSHVVQH